MNYQDDRFDFSHEEHYHLDEAMTFEQPYLENSNYAPVYSKPYQAQPINLQKRQYGYPRPGIDMTPPDATYHMNGVEESVDGRISTPFAANNGVLNTPQRPSEYVQDNVRIPLSRYMATKVPVGFTPEMLFAHKLSVGIAHDYPRKYNGWVHREYFTGDAQGANAAPAQRQRSVYQGASSPPQLQVSMGGLVIQNAQLVQKNLNINLAQMYKGASAPTSNSYAGMCK